ncbi:hypothetical protein ASE04_27460 [Rhizobium sp. Root708]|uniref:hypothetical protein n=1 Tax=Rhizobium sp. Root708 TaxID=1736592 RepID=UPI000700AA73|nr:hypothetical protein [Rhizobium sp. Root708]KRB58454.1 hypothetical protein ASE04_27460 [Rhizobium sp. Root708]
MSVAIWPEDLPRPERNTYQRTAAEARLKRQAEAPTPAYRRRFSSVPKMVTLSVMLSRAGKGVFDTFYEEDTSHGALPFYMPDPTTDGWPILTGDGQRLLMSDGRPMLMAARWLCLFGDTLPVETIVGVEFRITFNVSVMP